MSVDYGSRIRAVCDYLETLPGDKYNFMWSDLFDGCGCVTAHGVAAGIIPRFTYYREAVEWLTGIDGLTPILTEDAAIGKGEAGKQAAIRSLRAYADKHYPHDKPKHTGLPDVVRDLFRIGAAA